MLSPKITRELFKDLSLLNTFQSEDTVKEFCRMSTQVILDDGERKRDTFLSKKLLEKAALKLEIDDPLKIDRCIAAIGHIFAEAIKFRYNSDLLGKLIQEAGIEFSATIAEFYREHQEDFVQLQNTGTFLTQPRYHNLEWRFDCIVASKAKLDQISPIVTLRIETESMDSIAQHHCVQTDVSNLKKMIEVIENALVESKTKKIKKIQKFF